MNDFKTIDECITEDIRTIGISGHVRPDGDCIGACLALRGYICKNYPDKEVTVFLEEIADSYKFLKGTDEIDNVCCDNYCFDLYIALDLGDIERLGCTAVHFKNAKRRICIDHHISNKGFGDACVVCPDASATCEILYTLMDKDKIDRDIAEALYTGIIHDCGVFQYTNTTPQTLSIASELIKYGFPFTKIIEESFYQKTYLQNQILGRALLESELICDKKVIFSVITKKDMDFYGVTPKDLDAIIATLRQTKGTEVAIFLYETAPSVYKVSMRSNNDVDVSRIAVLYNGGGHKKASGCTMTGSVHDVINNLTEQIERQLKEN